MKARVLIQPIATARQASWCLTNIKTSGTRRVFPAFRFVSRRLYPGSASGRTLFLPDRRLISATGGQRLLGGPLVYQRYTAGPGPVLMSRSTRWKPSSTRAWASLASSPVVSSTSVMGLTRGTSGQYV